MQYILLIYHNEEQVAAMSEKEMGALYKAYGTFTQGIVKSGHMRAGDALQPPIRIEATSPRQACVMVATAEAAASARW